MCCGDGDGIIWPCLKMTFAISRERPSMPIRCIVPLVLTVPKSYTSDQFRLIAGDIFTFYVGILTAYFMSD